MSVRRLGYKVKLDTNGSNPAVVETLLRDGLCEYYAVDYKAPAARYAETTGCGTDGDADKVLQTVRMLAESGVAFEVRTTVIPQLAESDFLAMAQELPPVPRYVLNPYRRPETFRPEDRERVERTPYTKEQIKRLADAVRVSQPGVIYME
jgi:pyruvate formate lyase activating enzyme